MYKRYTKTWLVEIFPPRTWTHEILRNHIRQLRVNNRTCQFSWIQSSNPLRQQENETPIHTIEIKVTRSTKFTINLIDNTVFADFDKGERTCVVVEQARTSSRTILSFPFVMGPTKVLAIDHCGKRERERERTRNSQGNYRYLIALNPQSFLVWLRLDLRPTSPVFTGARFSLSGSP